MKRQTTLSAYVAHLLIGAIIPLFVLLGFKPGDTTDTFRIPVIINKGKPAGGCLSPRYMLNAWYHIELQAKFGHTLDLSLGNRENAEYLDQFHEPPAEKGIYSSEGLKLIVDTINELSMTKQPIWASYLFHRSFDDKRMLLQDDTLVQEVESFGIYLVNESNDKTAQVNTQDGSLMMVAQAKNASGKWEPIEYWSHSWCGNSYFTMALAPKHYLFTRGIKCSGEFKTRCRMALSNGEKEIYSNEFYMNINKTQFNKPKGAEP